MHALHRSQWVGIDGAPMSTSLALDAVANNGNVGMALQLANDKLGAQGFLTAYANYAYRIKVNYDGSARLALGLGLGVVQRSLDGTKLDPRDVGDAFIPSGTIKDIAPDARLGAFYSDDRFYIGLSADNLVAQRLLKNDLEDLNMLKPKTHYYLTAGGMVPFSMDFQLKPSFLLKDDRGGPTSLDMNLFALIGEKLWLGASYRTGIKLYDKSYLQRSLDKKNSIVAMAEFFVSPSLRIGYAYDHSLSKLQGYSGGSHEISIGYFLKFSSARMLTPRYY